MALARKATPKHTNVVRLSRSKEFEGIPIERAESYARIFEHAIREKFGGVMFFTREDLIHLDVFSHISTISRYRTVSKLVHFLERRGVLISKSWTNLCLTDHQRGYISAPLHQRFQDTIRTVVTKKFSKGETIVVMDIVDEWKTDPELTVNNKRVAVRGAIRQLLKDGVIKKRDEFEYTVQG